MWIPVFFLVVTLTLGEQLGIVHICYLDIFRHTGESFFVEPHSDYGGTNQILNAEEVKNALQTVSTASTTFADIKHSEEFIVSFLKSTPAQLINRLKGISVVAGIIAAFIPIPSESEQLLLTIKSGFETVLARITEIGDKIVSAIYTKSFHQGALEPVRMGLKYMNLYKDGPTNTSKASFLEYAQTTTLVRAIQAIITETPDILSNVMENSRYNRTQFDVMCSTLSRTFYEAFVLKFFRIGLQYGGDAAEFADQQQFLIREFEAWRKEFEEVLRKSIEHFENSFFPGLIVEDIVKPEIDGVLAQTTVSGPRGNWNNYIASSIQDKLRLRYPWRKFAVVAATTFGTYSKFDLKNQSIICEYKDRRVIVFMASKQYENVRTMFLFHSEDSIILKDAKSKFDENNLFYVLNWARERKAYQIVAFLGASEPYFNHGIHDNATFTAEFKMPVTILGSTMETIREETSLNFYVVF